MKRKQVFDIKDKIQEVEMKINKNQEKNPQIGNGGRKIKLDVDKNYNEDDLEAELGFKLTFSPQQE